MSTDVLCAQDDRVSFPGVPHEPGYDLGVDGRSVQVKAGLNPQTIHEHLEAHPDIPVLTPPEAAKYFQDVPKVVGLP